MLQPNMVIIYVDSPAASAIFYANLLNQTPIESSPTFSLFNLESGFMLGLCSKHTVEPATVVSGGGGEIGFNAANEEELYMIHADWRKRGLVIIQVPTAMPWGLTFVAIDPDGHRLRVFLPAKMENDKC